MFPPKILTALKFFYKKVKESDLLWVLSGSCSLMIQGVDVKINDDIDILTDKRGYDQIKEILKEYLVTDYGNSSTEKYKSYFAKFLVDGISLEVQGEFQYKMKDGIWSKPNQTNEIIYKNFQGMKLPLLKLEQELIEYENTGKVEKVERIKKKLNGLGV